MKTAVTAAALGIAAAVTVMTWREPVPCDAGQLAPAAPSPDAMPAAPTSLPPATQQQRSAAAGGVAILASAGRAQAVVAGVVSEVTGIDVHGWRAALRVDRVLLGDVRLGDTVTIAWEELSAARRVRFEDGQRFLVVLDPLPTQSLWRKRFPASDRAGAVLIVAAAGDAFLARPDGVTLDVLGHYLAMTRDARDGAPGMRRLAELVRGGYSTVAGEALTMLEGKSPTGDLLGAEGAASLLGAARSSEREPELRAAALRLAARDRLPGTRETALTLTETGSPIRADAYRALAALPDGLAAERVESLLRDGDPDLRVVGVEGLRGPAARKRLETLLRTDPSPAVRLAAGQALLARQGSGGIAEVIGLLDDPDAAVRSSIADSIGLLGADAVVPLRAIVDEGSERAALAAVLGLSRAGRKGGAMLVSIADTHRNKAVRAFARLALGKAPGHKH